ncbi:MAG TPA: hypothetical protein VJ716_05780 [Gaiellaceae bacterium]|nr:hypothetical protein [Gaiellaceae bacterium]
MFARAVSARDWLTPLAVLIPIGLTPVGVVAAMATWPPLAIVAVAGGLAATMIAGRRTCGVAASLVAAVLTWVAAVVSLVLWVAVSINTSICGKTMDHAWAWLPFTGGAVVFLAVGSFGFRTGRASSVVPLAFLGGVIVLFLLLAAVPGTHEVCET